MNLPVTIINMRYLRHNLDYLQSISDNAELYPVIKADAYGHGFKQIAEELDKNNIKGVCIATINELQNLINFRVNYSILHMGKIDFSEISLYSNDNVIATINSMDDLKQISEFCDYGDIFKVHIKVDTGMTRMGCAIEQFDEIFEQCLNMDNIRLEGVYSHLANSDNSDANLNQIQINSFIKIIDKVKKQNNNIKFHILNSGGLFNYGNYKYNLVRTGLSIYGISPLGIHNENLKPVMEFKAPVILKKHVKEGVMIGYGNSYQSTKNMDIAIVQCGYGDGLPFEFSNKGFVYCNTFKIPIVGRVSMDLICIDITGINIEIDDYVTLWGSVVDNGSRLEYIAKMFNKIPYIFMTGISSRVRREYVYE